MDESSDRRAQILDAALEEFADKGFRGATIKSIAERARLQSQALIYWYFPSKESLFREVVERHLPVLQVVREPERVLDSPPEEVLPQFARAYLEAANRPGLVRVLRLIVPEAIRRPDVTEMFGRHIVARLLGFLQTYLERQVELGRLRPHDVRASSRAFVGMVLSQLGIKLFFPMFKTGGPTDEEHVRAIVEIFLQGLSPEVPGQETRR